MRTLKYCRVDAYCVNVLARVDRLNILSNFETLQELEF
jgi:hypothetical protein